MRFKKGSRVEVMNKKDVPSSWRLAEIVSGNGHTYNLRYHGHQGVEKVSRKFIRPCPPAAKGIQSWVAGDIVEVFDDRSWKIATVSKRLGEEHFSVRPHGLSHEICVAKSHIRVRQSWQDGQWVPIGKISGSYGDVKFNKRVKESLPVYNDTRLQESHVVSSKTLKRASPFRSYTLEAKRFKADRSLEKVDAFAYPRETLGNNKNNYYETEKGKSNGVVGCSLARISEPHDSENDQCSVGSCSVSSDFPDKLSNRYVTFTCQKTDILSSDAESFNNSRDFEENCAPPPPPEEEDVAASIRRLELHAYRSTLEALYASGPLSWEKEALLTNLRIDLHISNDEHLKELRHLISPAE